MKQTPAQRARAPDEILRSRKTEKPLEVDFEWYVIIVILFENLKKFHSLFARTRLYETPTHEYRYLEHQILPPISRLCSVIAGTSQGNLAQAMGLNASKYV